MKRKIFNQIKKHQTIIIARHVGPDPDALASQFALREAILETFPNKEVYAVGSYPIRYAHYGKSDKISPEKMKNSLLIALDVPDFKRIDGIKEDEFSFKIKIDHHPLMEKFADIEWIDEETSSTAEMIVELILNTKLKITKKIAENLFMGIVADSNRFLFTKNPAKLFKTVANLVEQADIEPMDLYGKLYERSLKELKFQGYIATNLEITENGLAHIYLTDQILKEHKVDPATAGNMINNFNFVEGVYIWVIFSEDKNNENIRVSIRSRGPAINDVAEQFGGGGHMYASGTKLKNKDDIVKLIKELDKRLKN